MCIKTSSWEGSGCALFRHHAPEKSTDPLFRQEQREHCKRIPNGFKILVSTDRYSEFLEDHNWMPYIPYIEPVEYDTYLKMKDFTIDALTYRYLTSAGGSMSTSQTGSQDLSGSSALRLTYEVISSTFTIKGWLTPAKKVSGGVEGGFSLSTATSKLKRGLYVHNGRKVVVQ